MTSFIILLWIYVILFMIRLWNIYMSTNPNKIKAHVRFSILFNEFESIDYDIKNNYKDIDNIYYRGDNILGFELKLINVYSKDIRWVKYLNLTKIQNFTPIADVAISQF